MQITDMRMPNLGDVEWVLIVVGEAIEGWLSGVGGGDGLGVALHVERVLKSRRALCETSAIALHRTKGRLTDDDCGGCLGLSATALHDDQDPRPSSMRLRRPSGLSTGSTLPARPDRSCDSDCELDPLD